MQTILPASESSTFGERLRSSILKESLDSSVLTVVKGGNVYTAGDRDDKVYLIERGQIKIVVLSPAGKECLLAIYAERDFFGELCLARRHRSETATAMKDAVLRQMPCEKFMVRLTRDGLQEGFIKYLAVRLAEQQQVNTDLLLADSEHRLAATLLRIARKLGKQDPRSLRIEERITHEELSAMVGTTRSRVGQFLQHFRDLGLIDSTVRSVLVVKERRVLDYLEASLVSYSAKSYEQVKNKI